MTEEGKAKAPFDATMTRLAGTSRYLVGFGPSADGAEESIVLPSGCRIAIRTAPFAGDVVGTVSYGEALRMADEAFGPSACPRPQAGV